MAKPKTQENHLVRNVVAGVAAVGAGLLAAKVLSNEETREDIGNTLKKVEKKGSEVLSNLNEAKDDLVERLIEEFEALRDKIEDSKEAKDLQKEIKAIGQAIEKMKESNEDEVNEVVEQVKASVAKLRSDFEEMQNK